MIFLSYRISDTPHLVDRLDADLIRAFSRDAVFRDKTRLQGGQNWTRELENQARTRRVMLVVIGPTWQTAAYTDPDRLGELRLGDPQDWVRKEITFALGAENVVLPVLLDDVGMPGRTWLAKYGLERLHEQQAMRLRVSDYADDLGKLVERLRKVCPELQGRVKPRPASGTKPTVPAAYREWLREQCGDIELLGLQLKHGQAARLNQVYVPLTTAADFHLIDYDAMNLPAERPSSGLAHADLHRGNVLVPTPQMLLDLLDKGSLYVSGAPGAGKSTFCRWVTWLACAGTLPPSPIETPEGYAERFPEVLRDRLPVLLRLREFWTFLPEAAGGRELSQQQLEQVLAEWWQGKKPAGADWEWPDLLGFLRQGSALLILDGVDEVPLTRGEGRQAHHPRAMLLAGLAAAIPDWVKRGNRLLLTSRPYGISEAEGRKLALRHAPIDDLAGPGQELLVRRWFHILADNPAGGAATAQDLLDHLRGREELDPLAVNPMLLTAMCIIYHQGKRLPHDKYDLYDRIVDNVLYNRYLHDPGVMDLVRNRLSVLAHGMHTGAGLGEERATPQAEATYAELDRMLQAYQDQKSWTEPGFKTAVDTREQLLSHTGLLLPRGDRRAGFYHFSFQEFLAAQRVLDVEGDRLFEVFRERAAAAEWRNTLSFVFASQLGKCTSPERGIRLLGRLIEALSLAGPMRGLLGLAVVVADCLQILLGKKIHLQPELEEKFRQTCLGAIEHEAPVRERCLLGLALGQLGDPRVVQDLRDRAAFVEIPAGDYLVGDEPERFRLEKPYLLARYPVTNSQYALFMQEKGYENRAWWSAEGWRWRCEKKVGEPAWWRSANWNSPNQPVVGVSFWEAEAFAAWACGWLPGEYEWEAAARGPEGLEYPWGGKWDDGICNSIEARLGATSPVGFFPSSRSERFGLEDMAGNVWEWCADFYDRANESNRRVLRGGSWFDGVRLCRAADRYGDVPDFRSNYVGFRVALPAAPGTPGGAVAASVPAAVPFARGGRSTDRAGAP